MALLAFTFGDYLATLVPLGEYGATLFAAATIVALAAVNLAGIKFGIGTQVWLLWLVIARHAGRHRGRRRGSPRPGAPPAAPRPTVAGEAPLPFALGSALVFVFLAYGGWSDTATLSAEMRDARHGIKRALVLGMGLVTRALRARELGVLARPVASTGSRAARRRRPI